MSLMYLDSDDTIIVERFSVGILEDQEGRLAGVGFEMLTPWSGRLLHPVDDIEILTKFRDKISECILRLNQQNASVEESPLSDSPPSKPVKGKRLPVDDVFIPAKKLKANPRKPAVKKTKKR